MSPGIYQPGGSGLHSTVATSLTGYTFVVAGPTYIAWTSGEEDFVLPSGASVPRRIEGVLGPRP